MTLDRADPVDGDSLSDQLDRIEKQIIIDAINKHDGSLKHTYEALQISRKTLYDKMKKHGITVGEDT